MSDTLRNPAVTQFLEDQWSRATTYGQREIIQSIIDFSRDMPDIRIVSASTIHEHDKTITRLQRSHSDEVAILSSDIDHLRRKLEEVTAATKP